MSEAPFLGEQLISTGIDFIHDISLQDEDWVVPPAANVSVLNNVIDGANLFPNVPFYWRYALGGIQSFPFSQTLGQTTASLFQNLTLSEQSDRRDAAFGDLAGKCGWRHGE